MQLNVLKKAYTAKTSKLDQRSYESLDKVICIYYTRYLNIMNHFNFSLKTANMTQCLLIV